MRNPFLFIFLVLFNIVQAQKIEIGTFSKCNPAIPYLTQYTVSTKLTNLDIREMFVDSIYPLKTTKGSVDLKYPGFHELTTICINLNFPYDTTKEYTTFFIDTFKYKKLSPLVFPNPADQCFENNLLHIKDTTHANDWGLKTYRVDWGDGKTITISNPTFPLELWSRFADLRGGNPIITITSEYCIADTIKYPGKIRPKMGAGFTIKDLGNKNFEFKNTTLKSYEKGDRLLWNFMDGSAINEPRNSNGKGSSGIFTRKMNGNLINPFPMLTIKDTFGCVDSFRLYSPANNYQIKDTNSMCSIEGFVADSGLCDNGVTNLGDYTIKVKNKSGELLGIYYYNNLNQKYKVFTDYTVDSIYISLFDLYTGKTLIQNKPFKYNSSKESVKNVNFILHSNINEDRKTLNLHFSIWRPDLPGNLTFNFYKRDTQIMKNAKILLNVGHGFTIDTAYYQCHTAGKNSYIFQLGNLQLCQKWMTNISLNNNSELLNAVNINYPISATVIYDNIKSDSSAKLEFFYLTKVNKLIAMLKNTGNKDMESPGYLYANSSTLSSIFLKRGDSVLFTSSFLKNQINEYTATYGSLSTTYNKSVLIVKYNPDNTYYSESFQEKQPKYNNIHCVSRQRIRYSYDPNEKLVTYKGDLNNTKGPFPLHYTIHFQNTGTDTAHDVIIRDPLFGAFDISTFKITNTSHPCQFNYINGVAEFNFKNIYLVDSATNPSGSQGFVEFDINGLADGVQNYADIYFDLNEPVRTNTAIFKMPTKTNSDTRICTNYTKADTGPDIVTCNSFLPAKFQRTDSSYYTVKKAKYNIKADTFLYTLHLIGCADTLEDDVYFIQKKMNYQLPLIAAKGNDSLTCTQSGEKKYYWYIDDCKLPMETRTIKASWQGTYSLRLSPDSCLSDKLDNYYWVRNKTAKTTILDKLNLTIYPNPTKGILNIEGLNSTLKFNIYDMSGKLYLHGQVNSLSPFIQAESLKPGMYLLRIEINGGNQASILFVKE